MKRHTRKIAIIGTGLVGSSCAYSIVNQRDLRRTIIN